jgi:D-alanyl-lipoteichoic acid acyltransferase DltB (MBOAT superfamily)
MIFTDPAFLFLFFPVFALLFFAMGRRFGHDGALSVIFAASMVCYFPWGWLPFVLLSTSIVFNFAVAALLGADSLQRREDTRRWLHIGGQVVNFAILIWFKYQVVQYLLATGGGGDHVYLMMAIPAGISFYTFHQAAFLADAYAREPNVVQLISGARGMRGRLASFARYGAFVSFFPQLVIGPITYMKEFYPQVMGRKFGRFSGVDASIGLALIASGLFKKLVLADNVNFITTVVFFNAEAGAHLGAGAAAVGMMAYYAQLYLDFSGYSDIALGLARFCGIRYPINFFSPLKAVGILDFYRRWHMTLTRVISRFVFTPLSVAGTRRSARWPKKYRRLASLWLPLLINFELIALWHGATMTFVLFGLIHGTWYVAETEVRATKWFKAWRARSSDLLRQILGRLIFTIPMMMTFALFRSDSVAGFGRLIHAALGLNGVPAFAGGEDFGMRHFAILGICFFVIGVLPNSIELMRRYRPGLFPYANPLSRTAALLPAWRPTWSWAILSGVLMLASLWFIARQPPFLYQGF